MKIIDKKVRDILNSEKINSKFTSAKHNHLNIRCNILKENFFLDTYNYFPITEEYYAFREDFSWGAKAKYEIFFSKDYLSNFNKNKNKFKSLSNIFVLGSSPANNYYRNMITFLPRVFFLKPGKINIAIHRNCSNKFRNFIMAICKKINIQAHFSFLDDGIYHFIDSQIPQFINKRPAFKILNLLKIPNNKTKDKIYVTRQNANYRNLINEEDVVNILKKDGFRTVDLNNMNVFEQIELFSNAKFVVSPTGSSLTNLVFCSPGTKVVEIKPKYNFEYEINFKNRYSYLCDQLDLNYFSVEADPINLDKLRGKTKELIQSSIVNESNYYKNLLLKLEKVSQIIAH
ncbi:glycosyltransferase family 61 protein [Alphaproteobacteria bacterium]|nr:glycosyltransferase family 61 protein [Alphaproteobacteria bacterium]